MTLSDLIGYIAAIATTTAFVPQAWKVFKSNKTSDISVGMFLLMTGGVGVWLVYGIMLEEMPIILANAVTFLLSTYILIKKINLDHRKKH